MLKRTGTAVRLIVPGSGDKARPDPSLVRLLVRAFGIRDRLDSNPDLSIQRIAEAEGIVPSYATRLLRLSFLAPDIVAAILQGHQPPELTANKQRWIPKFGQVAKVGSRPRRRSLECHGRDGVILLS